MSWESRRRRTYRRSDDSYDEEDNDNDGQEDNDISDDKDEFFSDNWFSDFDIPFRSIDRMIESMWRSMSLASSIDDEAEQSEPGASVPNTIYYGYQISIGPDGKPHIREFGNARPTRSGRFEIGSREPFVDTIVDQKEGILKVVAEMPGLKREDITLQLTNSSLIIQGASEERKYDTTVPLEEVPVINESAKATYNNGVLEVRLKLKESLPKKAGGVNIRVD